MPKNAAHGRIVWHDLTTVDTGAAKSFYTQVLPWGTQPFDDANDYTMWTAGGAPIGGVMSMSAAMKAQGIPPSWLAYVCVYDVDACTRQAATLGGKVVVSPTEVPHV